MTFFERASELQESFNWLAQRDLQIPFRQQKLEYRIKGPLYAASFILETAYDGVSLSSRAVGQASLAFGKKKTFTAESANAGSVNFVYRDYLDARAVNGWSVSKDGLSNDRDGIVATTNELSRLPAPVLDPLTALVLVGLSSPSRVAPLATIVTIGRKLYFVRWDADSASENKIRLTASYRPLSGDTVAFAREDFSSLQRFEVEVDVQVKACASISAKLPVLGTATLKLAQFERS